MLVNTIDPNEINDELLSEIYREGIGEKEITNPALKVAYHYYRENKAKEEELATVKAQLQRNGADLSRYKGIANEFESKYRGLLALYQNLQKQFKDRISLDEKNIKNCLSILRH